MPKHYYKRKKPIGVSKKTAKAVRKIVHDVNKREEERKAFDFTTSFQIRDDNAAVYYLNAMASGDSADDRVGLQVKPQSLEVRVLLKQMRETPNGSDPLLVGPTQIRMIIWRDMAYDGTNPLTVGDICEGGIPLGNVRGKWIETPKRFQILIDKFWCLGSTNNTVTTMGAASNYYSGSGDKRQVYFHKKVKLSGKIMFEGTTNLSSDGAQGSIFVGFLSDVPAAEAGQANRCDISTQLIYTDA